VEVEPWILHSLTDVAFGDLLQDPLSLQVHEANQDDDGEVVEGSQDVDAEDDGVLDHHHPHYQNLACVAFPERLWVSLAWGDPWVVP
jgi:hypothetical protein